MRPVWLDYQRLAPKAKGPAWLLMLAGLLCGGAVLGTYFETQDSISELEYRIEKKQRAIERRQQRERTDMKDVVSSARRPAKSTPERWERLFGALEQAADETVTLLSLDPGESEISLSGEAKNFAEAAAYAKRLEETGALTEVHLLNHEVAKDHPQRPVRFVLSARWKAAS